MAQFQSEIELRVKVIDKELRDLEKRAEKIQNTNPFSASGGRRGASQAQKQTAALKAQRTELVLIDRSLKQQSVEQVKLLNKRTAWLKVLKEGKQISKDIAAATEKEAKAAAKVAANRKKERNQKIGSGISGAAISASFPLLTGGGGLESVLGGVGGGIGGLLGGGIGSFAGGIFASAIGRLISDAEKLNKELVSLNAQFGSTGAAALLTAGDVGELAKQLNITKEDVISLAGELAAFAQLSAIEDLAKAFGPVGGAGTFDALAQAAESEAAALKAIDGLRGQIGLKTAEELLKVLEIEGSKAAQAALLDALLGKTEDITEEVAKQVTFWDRIAAAVFTAASGQYIAPEDLAGERVDGIVGPDTGVIKQALADYEKYLQTRRSLDEKYNPKAERKGRAAAAAALPQSKELQLRQQILQTELAVSTIQGKRAALQLTDLEAVRAKEQLLAASLVKETQILELARQQALTNSKVPEDNALINELYDDRLKKIQAQNFLLREQNGLAEKNILLQRDLVALRNEQQTEGIVQGLGRGIEDANSRSSSEMLSLRIKQLRRQEDLISGINDKLAEQKLIEGGDDAEKAAAATREIGFLQDRKAAIEALLPALNQAEQQQLKYNQALAAVTPGVNALVGGLRDVIAGTKTAEEAFADFLNTVADQLIQTAATMIAQYIAIGIAKQFAFGPSGGGFNLSGGGSSVGSGGLPGIDSLSGLFNGSLPFIGSGMAGGGPVNSGSSYIVGEAGPELFIPGVSGTVTNNDQFAAAYDAMSGSGGGSSTAFSENSDAIAVSNSYTRERTLERERNETSTSSGTMLIETQVINSVEYATVEQVDKAATASAKQARAQVFSDMRSRPATRRSVGMK